MEAFNGIFPIIKEDFFLLKDWMMGNKNVQEESQLRRIEEAKYRALAVIATVFSAILIAKTLLFVITFPLAVLSQLLLAIVSFAIAHDVFRMSQKVYLPELNVESFTKLLTRRETITPEVAKKLTEDAFLQSLWLKWLKQQTP